MELGNGQARSEFSLQDYSQIAKSGVSGITAVLGITKFGEIGKPKILYSWAEYQRNFGGYTTHSNFPMLCKRTFDRGGILCVSRAAHFTDPTDITTADGVKATGTINATNIRIDFIAKSIGDHGNLIKVEIIEHKLSPATKLIIAEEVIGEPGTRKEYEFNVAGTTEDITKYNADCRFAEIDTIHILASGYVAGTITLSGGSEDYSALNEDDFVGDATAGTGIQSFNDTKNIDRIALFQEFGSNRKEVIVGMVQYAESRHIMSIYGSLVNSTGYDACDERDNYDIDSYHARQVFGAWKVKNPLIGIKEALSSIGDWIGKMTAKDNKLFPWYSESGPKRGDIPDNPEMVYNVRTASRIDEANLVDLKGISQAIDHEKFGTVLWGNKTLWKENTLLKWANVAELVLFLWRTLPQLTDEELFDPNDIQTWRAIWRRVTEFMDYVQTNRGVYDYIYEGDQYIDKIEDAQINDTDSIANGIYKFRLFVKPIGALQYIGIEVVVTKSDVNLQVLAQQI